MVNILRILLCGLSASDSPKASNIDGHNSVPHYHKRSIHDTYVVGSVLGQRGTFGEARIATHRTTKVEYAVKIVRKQKVLEKMLRNEEYILRQLRHQHVAVLFEVYEDRKNTYFVLEKCGGGDLIDLIQLAGGRLDERRAATIIRDISEALQSVHARGFAHCDIKPSNILFKDDVAKLIDFGVSQSTAGGIKLHQEVGSPSFMAPEVINGCYDSGCDMWSLGVVLFVALYGFNPFNPRAMPCFQAHRRICETVLHGFEAVCKPGYGAFFSSNLPISDGAKDLLKSLLTYDASKRITTTGVLNHPWIRGLQV